MEDGQLWAFAAQFVVTLSISVGWLIIARALRSLRLKIGVTFAYLVAAALALLACMLPSDVPTWSGLVASSLVMTLMYLRWKRSLKMQSLETGTIVGFELT
jgi:uncharacterized membrane protein YciS (DUF1049 family)